VVRDPSKALKKLTPIEHLMTGGAAGHLGAFSAAPPRDGLVYLWQMFGAFFHDVFMIVYACIHI